MKNHKIHYIHLETVDSTSTWAKTHAADLSRYPLVCITAHRQTAGYGRFKKPWSSPPGVNLTATFFFTAPLQSTYLSNLSQIMSLSCAQMLRKLGLPAEIKWPNDILIKSKKIAGILTETVSLDHTIGVAIGIGINVNMEKTDIINQPATSLLLLTGKPWDIQTVLELLIDHFIPHLEQLQLEGFAPFQVPYQDLLAFKGKTIQCSEGKDTVEGICQGITETGQLKLLLASGEIKLLSGGFIA